MADPASHAAEVLATEALADTTVAWQDDVHLGFRTTVKDVLLFLLDEVTGKSYAGMWSDHLDLLLEIEAEIEKAGEIDDAIGRFERGLATMTDAVDRTSREVARLPTTPPGGLALLFLAPAIKADPVASAELNHTLQQWEDAARVATEHADQMLEVARRFKDETPDLVDGLLEVVRKAPPGVVNEVLKNRYRTRLGLLLTAVTSRVLPAVEKADRASEHARASWRAARNVGRFR